MITPAPRVRTRLRVALIAEQRLVGEAVRVALDGPTLDVSALPWIGSRLLAAEHRRRITVVRPQIGVLVGTFERPRRRAEVLALVQAVRLPWVLLVDDPSDPVWGSLAEAGVVAILSTSVGLQHLEGALSAISTGQGEMTQEERTRLVEAWRRLRDEEDEAARRVSLLTPRELAVLGLLFEGHPVLEIAEQTGVSELTVRSQVKAVLRKLEVRSQLGAVAVYRRVAEPRTLDRGRG